MTRKRFHDRLLEYFWYANFTALLWNIAYGTYPHETPTDGWRMFFLMCVFLIAGIICSLSDKDGRR